MDGHFARDQIYGLFINFFDKIGTFKFSSRPDLCVMKKEKNKGVISKKKKVTNCILAPLESFLGRNSHNTCHQADVDLFWGGGINPMSFFLSLSGLTTAYPSSNLVDKGKKRESGTFHGKSGTAGQGLQKRDCPA